MITGSKKELLDLIKRNGILSINQAVEKTDLAKTTIREHFLQLERDGYITRKYKRSGPGRPSLNFELTAKGETLFPSSEPSLARELINYLLSKGDKQTVEAFFESYWQERLEKARDRMDESPRKELKSQLQSLMSMLEEEGFMPEFDINPKNDAITVKECNCPFSEVIKDTRLPCKLEAMFYEQLFKTGVERTEYIAEGDHSCTYEMNP